MNAVYVDLCCLQYHNNEKAMVEDFAEFVNAGVKSSAYSRSSESDRGGEFDCGQENGEHTSRFSSALNHRLIFMASKITIGL